MVDRTLNVPPHPHCQYPNKEASKMSEELLKRDTIKASLILESGLQNIHAAEGRKDPGNPFVVSSRQVQIEHFKE